MPTTSQLGTAAGRTMWIVLAIAAAAWSVAAPNEGWKPPPGTGGPPPRQAVRPLADERIAPRAPEIDASGEFPWDIKELLAEHEILALPFPPEYGGVSGELLTLCLAIEEIARVCVTSSLILAVQALAARPILIAGTDEQKRRWIPDLAAGKRLPAPPPAEAGGTGGAPRPGAPPARAGG